MFDMTKSPNTYIPVRHTIMPKPNLYDSKTDQMLYKFNDRKRDGETHTQVRVNPNARMNPLKGYDMGPDAGDKNISNTHKVSGTKFSKWRRLSHKKNLRNFSTAIERP